MDESILNLAPDPPHILLVDLRPEERRAVADALADTPLLDSLLVARSLEEAAAVLQAEAVAVLLCGLPAFAPLQEAAPTPRPPTLVLVPSGAEERAALLLERGDADVLLRSGNYLPLLVAWVPQALRRPLTSWEEIGRIVRHEINNPLTGVLGNAELVLADPVPLPASVRDRLATIASLAVRIRDVVRSLEDRLSRRGNPGPLRSLGPLISPSGARQHSP